MATRTLIDTVTAKASGDNLTISSVSLTENQALLVAVGFHGTSGPVVKKGATELSKSVQRIDDTEAFGCAIYLKRRINQDQTVDITADWTASIGARVMLAIKLDKAHALFEAAGNKQSQEAAPTTGAAINDLLIHDCFHWGILVSEGPVTNDAAPSLPGDWYTGERAGTDGVPPVSNITLLEGFKTGRCIDPEELDGTGATERDWCNCLVSLSPVKTPIPLDMNATEILVGDTVKYDGVSTSTVSSFENEQGHPFTKVTLANGFVFNAHALEIS